MQRNIISSIFITALLVLPSLAENSTTESAIERAVENQLMWDSRVQQEEVEVSVDGTDVTLSGVVDSATARSIAEVNAWQVPGVYEVNNLLIVSYGDDFTIPTDNQLSGRVKNLLSWSSPVDASDITVSADAGKITLEGTVPTLWQKIRAKELALDALGVYRVENELALVPEKEFGDQLVADIVVDAIKLEPKVDVSNVDVRVDDGVVTLTGVVEDKQAKLAAADSAIFTTGVLAVVNNLLVDSDS